MSTPAAPPALGLRKRAPEVAMAGEPITYTLQIHNQGLLALDNLTVRDQVPAGAVLQAVPGGAVVPLPTGGQQVEWQVARLETGAQTEVRFVVTATQSLLNIVYTVQTAGGYVITGGEPVLTLVSSDVTTGAVNTVDGGVITAQDESLQVVFPPGAVTTPVSVTVISVSEPISTAGFVGVAFQIEATDATGSTVSQFQQPLVITVQYRDQDLQNAGITDEQNLNLYYWDGTQWVATLPCAGCFINSERNTITVAINHLTLFAVRKAYRVLLPLLAK